VIYISETSNRDITGQYHEVADCGMRDLYQHRERYVYLYYYSNSWWVVGDQQCNQNNIDDVYIRVKDSAHSPEYIRGYWEERNGSNTWITNPSIKVECQCMYITTSVCIIYLMLVSRSIICYLRRRVTRPINHIVIVSLYCRLYTVNREMMATY